MAIKRSRYLDWFGTEGRIISTMRIFKIIQRQKVANFSVFFSIELYKNERATFIIDIVW